MKVLFILSSLLVFVLADEHDHHQHHPDAHGVHQNCQDNAETHIANEIFEKLSKDEHAHRPSNYGKHQVCMMQGLGFMTHNGKANPEGMKAKLSSIIHDHSKVQHVVHECAVDKESAEHTALHMDECLTKHHVSHRPGDEHQDEHQDEHEHEHEHEHHH